MKIWERFKHWVVRRKKLLIVVGILLIGYYFILPKKLFNTPTSYVIEDSNGNLLSATIANDGQWRFPAIKKVPEKFEACILAYEDKRFRYHWGVDPVAMSRALKQNISGKKVVSGGSTITMQVIRLYRDQPRTLWQKCIEMVMATRLEFRYSKNTILALYASNAPFGGNVVGLEAAAWRYYGRRPEQLSWGEMAALAVLPNSPALVHPGRNRQTLTNKRNQLLDKLRDNGTLDAAACNLAKLEPIPDQPYALPQLAPHLLDKFKKDLAKQKIAVETRLQSTLDGDLQLNVTRILDRHHVGLKANNINNAAALVLDLETGNTLAYVGNIYHPENPELQSHVDIIQAPRSPGSTLKPLLYSAMLTDGLILPNSLIADVPTQIAGYTPQNFDLGFDGAVAASRALSRSLNIPSVGMLRQYRTERFHALLKRMGITTLNRPSGHYGLSMILGGGETTLWELTGMYASMGRLLLHYQDLNGKYDEDDVHAPQYIANNQLASKHSPSTNGPVNAGAIWYTLQAMEEVMRPGEELLWQQFSSTQRVAWKTGTSFGFRDGWAIGITPKYVVGVWVGNADGEGRPGLVGVQTAAPIMFEIFRQLSNTAWFNEPQAGMSKIAVCRQSGYRVGEHCVDVDTMLLPVSCQRAPVCPYHQLVHLDPTGQYRVTESCESPYNMQHKSWFVLPPAMEFYYRTKHVYAPLPPYKPGCEPNAEQGHSMELIYPRQGAKIYIPIEIDGTQGQTVFKATHRNSQAKVFWHLDNEYIGTTETYHQLAFKPKAGKHTLTIVDEDGEQIQQTFEILEKDNKRKL
ncbi:penicillin-binding protein 1C [Chitinophaga skermanii]|uniref:peptidoglycan glycosyltransferase n=1 Tax=Chitinophaga skermanii TaxID=331697 RepID=A0A327R1W5_9BACT|nr:penicillin-binding protein 1C [Chitinophaga skermanii]RAJ10660.1 penicillin-binding protein 1C [Chitinophaga skermanii]